MKRRQLLKGLGLVSVAAINMSQSLPSFSKPAVNKASKNNQLINAKESFNLAFKTDPDLIGFANTGQDFLPQQLTIEGKLPQDIQGCFYRNGPAKHERGNMRYLHLFEGDGMVHRFHFNKGELYHHGKFVQTPKFIKEQRVNKFLYSGPDSLLDNSLSVSHSDMINTANTNVIAVGDDLWALWEAGSATALDAKTLATKKQVNLGENSQYGDKIKGMAFSAHPKIETNGDIWNFGLAPSGHVVLYHLTPKGRAKNVGLINTQYKGGMIHDFLITHKHILLILPSFINDPNIEGFFAQIKYANNLPMKVLVIDKQNLRIKKQYELESGFAFHYGNAWEDKGGTIHFDASLYKNNDVLDSFRQLMEGDHSQSNKGAKTVLFSLKPNGTSSQYAIEGDSEFPRVFASKVGIKNQYLFTLTANKSNIWSDTVNCLDVDSGKKTSYFYGNEYLVEEHIPISPKHSNEQGYLMGTALHIPSKRTCLNIFKADNLSDGLLCRAWLPYHIPLGFHGNFKGS